MPHELVLLIEDDPDYEKLMSSVLAACGNTFEVKSASSLAAGLALIEQYLPELILVDLNLPDSSGYETFLQVREHAGQIPIIVLTGLDDDHAAVLAVEDGAQDYLVKSLTQPKLVVRCVNMALSRQKRQARPSDGASRAPGTVLAFIGSKGGVGTSTLAMNVAALLAQDACKTAVIELTQGCPGTLSLYSQTDPAHGLDTLLKQSADTITPSDLRDCWTEASSGLYLLCQAGTAGVWRPAGADHVCAIITAARQACRFVVLDLPARIDEGITEALMLSDSITMVVDRESAALHCGAAFLHQLKMAASRNKDVRYAVNDRSGLALPLSIGDMEKQLKMHPLAVIPAAGAVTALSQSTRTPLALLCPDEGFTLALMQLADHLIPPAAAGSSQASPWSDSRLNRMISWRTIPETTYS
jgi:Flp pilus assembly CpaE family ATPase